jgi:hypothetical protein
VQTGCTEHMLHWLLPQQLHAGHMHTSSHSGLNPGAQSEGSQNAVAPLLCVQVSAWCEDGIEHSSELADRGESSYTPEQQPDTTLWAVFIYMPCIPVSQKRFPLISQQVPLLRRKDNGIRGP